MEHNYDIFISYSRKDTEMANQICEALSRAGISYFIDRQGISGGQDFINVIIKAINQSRLFLFLASRNSYASRITIDEVFEALDGVSHGRRGIITYIIDNSELPDNLRFQLRRYNWRMLSQHPIEPTLINDLKLLLGKEPSGDPKGDDTYAIQQGAEIHIEVDADCELYRFKERLALLHAGEDNVVFMKPGKHKLQFVSPEFDDIMVTEVLSIPSNDYSDFMDISLKKMIDERKEQLQLEAFKQACQHRLQYAGTFVDGLAKYAENGRWGFIDTTGRLAISCIWNEAGDFSNGLARVKDTNGLWGFINTSGKIIAPCQFPQARDFKYGCAVVQTQQGNWTYMYGSGEIVAVDADDEDDDSLIASLLQLSPDGLEVNAKVSWELDQEMKKGK